MSSYGKIDAKTERWLLLWRLEIGPKRALRIMYKSNREENIARRYDPGLT